MSRKDGLRRIASGEILRRTSSNAEMELAEAWMRDGRRIAVWQDTDPASPTHARCQIDTYTETAAQSLHSESTTYSLIGVWDGAVSTERRTEC